MDLFISILWLVLAVLAIIGVIAGKKTERAIGRKVSPAVADVITVLTYGVYSAGAVVCLWLCVCYGINGMAAL